MTTAYNLSQLANKTNTSGQLDASTGLVNTVPIANGGTGQTATPANGEILIGNGTGFSKSTITAGTNISVTNSAGGITIANTSAGGLGGMQVFTTVGATTFTIPSGVQKLKITMVGGGGGGGGGYMVGGLPPTYYVGGGGGGGGYAVKFLSGLTSGNTLTVTVGNGGTAGTNSPSSGGAGGNSTISSGTQTITTITAGGGGGGLQGGSGTGGAGGSCTNVDLGITGSTGQTGGGGSTNYNSYGGTSIMCNTNLTNTGGFLYGGGGGGTGGTGYAGGQGFVMIEW